MHLHFSSCGGIFQTAGMVVSECDRKRRRKKTRLEKDGKKWTVHFCAKAAPLSLQSQGDREGNGEGGGGSDKKVQEVEM